MAEYDDYEDNFDGDSEGDACDDDDDNDNDDDIQHKQNMEEAKKKRALEFILFQPEEKRKESTNEGEDRR